VKTVVGVSPTEVLVHLITDRKLECFADGVPKLGVCLSQALKLFFGDLCGGNLGGESFEFCPYEICISDISRRRTPHQSSAVWVYLDQTRGLYLTQGFTDWLAADAELLSKCLLAEPCPHRELTGHYRPTDSPCYVVDG
jgi:hypothetical protein